MAPLLLTVNRLTFIVVFSMSTAVPLTAVIVPPAYHEIGQGTE